MSELEYLSVTDDCPVGWCEFTAPNETASADGSVSQFEAPQRDPRVPFSRTYDDPGVAALRDALRKRNGLAQVEICAPSELDRIAQVFYRDGFVVVRDLLNAEQMSNLRDGCVQQLSKILEIPGAGNRKYLTESFRLPHRYSYGTSSASRQLLHDQRWTSVLDLDTTTPILKKIFGPQGYDVMGAGGDVCLPGAIEYQSLHVDFKEDYQVSQARIAHAEGVGIKPRWLDDRTLDPRSQQMILVRTPPVITINFFMSDLTWENGPIRQIPGSHAMPFAPPSQEDEPEWMRLSTLVGAAAGAGVFRDSRAWHGATPNISRQVRAMPNVEYGASWLDDSWYEQTMPDEIYQGLSQHARTICRRVKADPGVWPPGAGIMHPHAHARQKAKENTG